MSNLTSDPYQILGVPPTATSKEILAAYTKALSAGTYDKTVLVEALSSLTNEAKRAEVDVLIVGEEPIDLATEPGPIDPRTLLEELASDIPAIDLAAFVPWADILSIPETLEPCTIEPDLPKASSKPAHDSEPPIDFPI